MRLLAPSIFLLAATLLAAGPADLRGLVPEDTAARLRSGVELRRVFKDRDGLALFPDLPMRARERQRVDDLEPTVGVEFLVLYKPAAAVDELAAYNALRSVSRLKGIEYFSATRGRMRVFFEDASFVDGPESSTRVPDPIADQVPPDGLESRVARVAELVERHGRYPDRTDEPDVVSAESV